MMSPTAPPMLLTDSSASPRDAAAEQTAARAMADRRIAAAVRSHHTFVWRCLRRLGVPMGSADDAAQGVFLTLSRRLSEVPVENERAFLFAVAVRAASNARKVSSRVREDGWSDSPPEVPSDAPSPLERLERKEELALLDELLETLPTEFRTVFILAELERMTAEEIAKCVQVPVGTVNSRLRRARELFERNVPRIRGRIHGGRS